MDIANILYIGVLILVYAGVWLIWFLPIPILVKITIFGFCVYLLRESKGK